MTVMCVDLGLELPWLPDANAVVNPTESFKDGQASVLNEICFTGYQEEIIVQDLE